MTQRLASIGPLFGPTTKAHIPLPAWVESARERPTPQGSYDAWERRRAAPTPPRRPTGPVLAEPGEGVQGARRGAQRPVTPRELYRRTRLVLAHFGVGPEPDTRGSLRDLRGRQTVEGLRRRLTALDPTGEFWHYARIVDTASGPLLRVYRDRDARQVLDYEVPLARNAREAKSPPESLHARLLRAADNPPDQPLRGLRIALDPGHMGKGWEHITGKYIEHEGQRVREGEIALATARMLRHQLTALGAEVMLTRDAIRPVTDIPYDEVDVEAHAREALRASTGADWFIELATKARDDAELLLAFEHSPEIKAMFSSQRRGHYFVSGADLDARSKAMTAFVPDITLVLHYDVATSGHSVNPKAPHQTKMYVSGGFLPGELSTREHRARFARHLLTPEPWEASVGLARSLVEHIGTTAGIPPQLTHSPNAEPVEPGIFARNLFLTRQQTDTALVFVEGFFYNRPAEFRALTHTRGGRTIDGVTYPRRLAEFTDALGAGLVSFVRNYGRQTKNAEPKETVDRGSNPSRSNS